MGAYSWIYGIFIRPNSCRKVLRMWAFSRNVDSIYVMFILFHFISFYFILFHFIIGVCLAFMSPFSCIFHCMLYYIAWYKRVWSLKVPQPVMAGTAPVQ